ncbi:putative stage IV sporulation protein YqfD [Oxobacter pfennigii]|uniref:Putative stage IV sporulation protein YqfD n=1 Tax=Oxobacter pfennigii TaxID=36849 RepID=A0A0P8WNJ5_9CLOT|nr:sporulation protein YqfD [Oxobacter pfennigii]KPU44113.1 putative stage IV sporulation protein YqfD [Oxobacter pfennigii]
MSRILKYLRGYLTIKVEGLNLEKFLNMSVSSSISFWDVKKIGITEIEFKTTVRGYKRMKNIIKATGSKAYITGKDGVPFLSLKLKRRKMMAIGFVVFILMVFMLSSFIWSVEIIGAKTVSTKEITDCLKELGLKAGAFKLNLAVTDIENDMLIKMDGISWIKVNIKGTRAEVEIKERIAPPDIIPDSKPCNIIARRDGIIMKIIAEKGDILVPQGEPVKKGQVLITGMIDRPNIERRYVHAAGEVSARTWYEGKEVIPLETVEKERSGKKISNLFLILGQNKLQIKNSHITFNTYDKIVKSTKLIETEKFQLPLEIVIEEYHETVDKQKTKSVDEAKKLAYDLVEKSIINSLPPDAKIINKNINVTVKENVVIASALIETIEDIGLQEEIK